MIVIKVLYRKIMQHGKVSRAQWTAQCCTFALRLKEPSEVALSLRLALFLQTNRTAVVSPTRHWNHCSLHIFYLGYEINGSPFIERERSKIQFRPLSASFIWRYDLFDTKVEYYQEKKR